MAWWETEARSGSARDQFQFDVARARARRQAAAAQAPAPPEQQTAAAPVPPAQTAVQGGAYNQTTQATQPTLQQPVVRQTTKPEMPRIWTPEEQARGEFPPVAAFDRQLPPGKEDLSQFDWGKLGKTPAAQWLRRMAAATEGRLREAWNQPTAAQVPEDEWKKMYPPKVQEAMRKAEEPKPETVLGALGEGAEAYKQAGPLAAVGTVAATGPGGALGRIMEQGWKTAERQLNVFETAGRIVNLGMGALDSFGKFGKGVAGALAIADHPDREGLTPEQIYPLTEATGSMLWGKFTKALKAPDADSDSIADLIQRLGAISPKREGDEWFAKGNPEVGEVLRRVKAGEDANDVAQDIYDPSAELLAEVIFDLLNVADVTEALSWGPKLTGKMGQSKVYFTRTEQALDKAADTMEVKNMARGIDQVNENLGDQAIDSISDAMTAKREALTEARALPAGDARDAAVKAAEEMGLPKVRVDAMKKAWRGTAGQTAKSLANRDVRDVYAAGRDLLIDVTSKEEAMDMLKRLVDDTDALAAEVGQHVLGRQGEKARLVYAQVLDQIPKLPSMNKKGFNKARFLWEVDDLISPMLKAAYGAKPPNKVQRALWGVKGVMSELYLNPLYSPRYVIGNFGVDTASGIFEGVAPGGSVKDIDAWFERIGSVSMRAATGDPKGNIRVFARESFLPKWVPWRGLSERGMEFTRRGQIRNVPVGEESRFRSVYKDQFQNYQRTAGPDAVPDLPPDLEKLLGPDQSDNLRMALVETLNAAEREAVLDTFLDAQNMTDNIPYTKLLTPEELDYLTPETHKYLKDRFGELPPNATADDAVQVIDDAIDEQLAKEAEDKLADLGDLPESVTSTDAAETEIRDEVDKQLDDAAESIRDDAAREKAKTDDIESAKERKRIDKEVDKTREEMAKSAAEIEGPEGMEILMAAARDHDDLLFGVRERLGKLRLETIEDYKANPVNTDALWINYRIRVNSAWTSRALERHGRMVEAVEQIQRFKDGEDLKSILGMTRDELANLRIKDGVLPREVDYIPGPIREADQEAFEGYLKYQRALVDRARSRAWKVGINAPPELRKDVIDAWNAAGHDVDMLGRQTAGRVEKRLVKTKTKADAAWARGDKLASEKFWDDFRVYAYEEWRKNTDAAEARWLLAEQNLLTQEFFKYAPPAPDIPTKPVQPGDKEIVEAAARKPKEAWTPEEQAAMDRWTMKEEAPKGPEEPPGTQPPLAPEAPPKAAPEVPPPGVFTRDQFHAALRDVAGYSDEEVEATMRISDARAQRWAKGTGRSPDEWYTERIAGVKPGVEVPPDATKQLKEGEIPLGAVDFLDDGRAMIYAFEQANVSTISHELGHIFRRELDRYDMAEASKWATGAIDGKWDAAAEDKFADGFLKYLADGSAPTPELAKVFERFKQWLTDIYKGISGSDIDVELNDEVRGVFDRLLAEEPPARAGDIYGKELEYGRRIKAEEAARVPNLHPVSVDTAMDQWVEQAGGEWGDWEGLTKYLEEQAQRHDEISTPKGLDAKAWNFAHGTEEDARWVDVGGTQKITKRVRGRKAERAFRRAFYRNHPSPKAYYAEQRAVRDWYYDLATQAKELSEGKKTLTEITPPEWLKDVEKYRAPTEMDSWHTLFQKEPEEIWTPKPKPKQLGMFEAGEDLPLFSGTPQQGVIDEFAPEAAMRQDALPGMEQTPEEILAADKAKVKKPAAAPKNQQTLFQRLRNTAEPWFYKSEQVIEEKMQSRATVDQVRSILTKAVKKDELEWTNILRWLDEQDRIVTKDDVLGFLRENQVRVEEVLKGQPLGGELGMVQEELDRARLAEDMAGNRLEAALVEQGWRREEAQGARSQISAGPEGFFDPDEIPLGIAALDLEPDLVGSLEMAVLDTMDASTRLGNASGQTGVRWSQHQLPGGEDYRELLLTMPNREMTFDEFHRSRVKNLPSGMEPTPEDSRKIYDWIQTQESVGIGTVRPDDFRTSHWPEDNVLVHIRFNERTLDDGTRVLFIEEIQSDWHQRGYREGYRTAVSEAEKVVWQREREQLIREHREFQDLFVVDDRFNYDALNDWERQEYDRLVSGLEDLDKKLALEKGVPPAPFAATYDELAFKRMMAWAAENDFDRIAWTTGKQQVERWADELRKAVDTINWEQQGDAVRVEGIKGDSTNFLATVPLEGTGDVMGRSDVSLEDVVGKKIANQMRAEARGSVTGDDLTIGGEFFQMFYDNWLPGAAKKQVKQWGGEVGKIEMPLPQTEGKFHVFDSTIDPDDPVASFNNLTAAEQYTQARNEGYLNSNPVFVRETPSTLSAWSATVPQGAKDNIKANGQSLFQKAQETNALQQATKKPGMTGDKAVAAEMVTANEQGAKDALGSLRQGFQDNWDNFEPVAADVGMRNGLNDWMKNEVTPAMNDHMSKSHEFARLRADDILLDYTKERGFDVPLSYLAPFNYWYTRTGFNWMRRFSRRPAMLAHYLRYRDTRRRLNEAAGKRQRFEGKVPVSAEWLPDDWMGNVLNIDPFRAMIPFASFGGTNWDDDDDSARGLRRMMNVVEKAGFRLYPPLEIPYQSGALGKIAEGLGVPEEEAQELYTPKREGEYGYAFPPTSMIKGATALAGVGGPGGLNIEGPFREALGLPRGQVWEPYQITRMLGNMMEGERDPQVAVDMLNAGELVTRWKEQKQHGNPWEPQNPIAINAARDLNWTPEILARAQAQLIEAANRAAKERGIGDISSLMLGVPSAIEPTGEAEQIELQRRANEKLWSPEQPGGTRAAYDQYRRDYPGIYVRQQQYGAIPGEEAEGFTPGQRGNWLARKEATEEINARYDAELDVPGLSEKEKKAITSARYDELDQVREQYPLPDMPEDMPAVKYGSSPEEAWDQLVEAELWDIKDSKPMPEDFMDGLQVRWTEYGDAVDKWEKSLPAAFGFGAVEGGKYAGMDPSAAYFLKWPKSTDEDKEEVKEEAGEPSKGYAATSYSGYSGRPSRPYYRSSRRRKPPIWTPRQKVYGGPFRG